MFLLILKFYCLLNYLIIIYIKCGMFKMGIRDWGLGHKWMGVKFVIYGARGLGIGP
jgi:hypothetical protein